jgi:hypothetical protein
MLREAGGRRVALRRQPYPAGSRWTAASSRAVARCRGEVRSFEVVEMPLLAVPR